MSAIVDLLSWFCLLGGGFFVLAGGVGVVRLPDVYTRSHTAGMTDTLGAGLILIGLMVQAGPTIVTVKLILVLAFLFFTSPTATHALAQAALGAGVKPQLASDDRPAQGEDGASSS